MPCREDGIRRLAPGRILVVIAGIYVTQSLVGSIMFMGIPAVMRGSGMPLDRIGLTALFMLPWTLKFLWSPMVERFRLPVDGRRRSLKIVVAAQALIVAMLALAALAPPDASLPALLTDMAAIATVAATLDIACDAFTVEQLRDRIRGWGNVMQVGGGYLGIALGSGLLLILVGSHGWRTAMLVMALLATCLTLPALFTREPGGSPAGPAAARPSLGAAFARAPIRWGLVLVVLFQLGARMIQGISIPLLVDRGAGLETLGMINGSLGIGISLLGVLSAGLAVRRWPATRLLRLFLVLHGVLFLALLSALLAGGWPLSFYFVMVLAENAVMAGAFVVLYTAAMRWSSLRQAGIDFTLFQCADAATAAGAGMAGAVLAHHAGYPATFASATIAVTVALALLPALLHRIEPRS
jgi:MFS transporter (putative signal transducer)